MRRNGFTLIEILIVVGVIVLLAALIIGVGAGMMRDRAKILTTQHRMNQVLTGLAQYSTGSDLPERLQRLAGCDKHFASLRSIMSRLTDTYGLDIINATKGTYPLPVAGTAFAYPSDGQLPPDLGNRWENLRIRLNASNQKAWNGTLQTPMTSRQYWASPESGLENVVTFMDRQIGREADSSASLNTPPLDYWPSLAQAFRLPSTTFWYLVAWDDVERKVYKGYYGLDICGFPGTFLARRGTDSSRGEKLNSTLEIQPDRVRPPSWYIQQWPNLVETVSSSGSVRFFQTAWPDSNWDQSTPGTVPVIWNWPWGKQIFSRKKATVIDQIEYRDDGTGNLKARTLAECSPLATIALLQAAGIVPADATGAKAYREDRAPSRAWNDAWGGPLIVVSASFLPARYGIDDVNDCMSHSGGSPIAGSGSWAPRDTRSMVGPRDFFMQKSAEIYRYNRSFYAAVGSLGGLHAEELTGTWAAANDAENLRKAWLRVRTETNAAEWDGAAFSSPPWNGVRTTKVKDGSGTAQRVSVSAPMEYK